MRAASRAAFAKHDSVSFRGVVRHQACALARITYGQGAARARGLVATLVEEAGRLEAHQRALDRRDHGYRLDGFQGGRVGCAVT